MAFLSQISRLTRYGILELNIVRKAAYSSFPIHYLGCYLNKTVTLKTYKLVSSVDILRPRYFSSDAKGNPDVKATSDAPASKLSQKARLKQAVRDYGATIIVFHVAISLASLGICYLAISNGVDVTRLLTYVGFSEAVTSSKVAQGGSTFAISYAVHKLFAPVRIGITLSAAPFIVRYLRKIKLIKPPRS